jgi:hypothetical protein
MVGRTAQENILDLFLGGASGRPSMEGAGVAPEMMRTRQAPPLRGFQGIPPEILEEAKQFYLEQYGEEGYGGDSSMEDIEAIAREMMLGTEDADRYARTDEAYRKNATPTSGGMMGGPSPEDSIIEKILGGMDKDIDPNFDTPRPKIPNDAEGLIEFFYNQGDFDAIQHLLGDDYDPEDDDSGIAEDFIRKNPEVVRQLLLKNRADYDENNRQVIQNRGR